MTTKLDEMWTAFEAHKPKPEYADAWATMLKERTEAAIKDVYDAAFAKPETWAWVAASAARIAVDAAAIAAMKKKVAKRYAQEAIDTIKREVKP